MKDLVRGGVIASLLSLFVVIIYAKTQPIATLAIANDSQPTIENTISNNNLIAKNTDDDDTKKVLVKTTVSTKASSAGAARGAFSASAYCFSGRTATGQGVR